MDNSFTSWRSPMTANLLNNSDSDSDVVEDSKSDNSVNDSELDNSESFNDSPYLSLDQKKRNTENSSEAIIQPSDEDESITSSRSSLTLQNDSNLRKTSIKPPHAAINSSSKCSVEENLSSPELLKYKKNKNKARVIESDDESISENRTHSKDAESNSEDPSPFKNENICSSTRLNENSNNLSRNSNTRNESVHNIESPSVVSICSNSHEKNNFSIIDLTVQSNNVIVRNEYRNLIEDVTDDDDDEYRHKNRVIIVDSDSEKDEPRSENKTKIDKTPDMLDHSFSSMKISPVSLAHRQPNPKKDTNKANINTNDYLSRKESLIAEETKLKMQVSEVCRNIETTKKTLHTANLAALPDKGVRLQIYLKEQEAKLRDLRYQQSTLSNEILKLQLTSTNSHQPSHQNRQMLTFKKEGTNGTQQGGNKRPGQMYKLPTMNTDLNVLGKKAMETHRIQQALTVDALRALHNSLKNCPKEDSLVHDPKGLVVELMSHQKHGLAWLLWREKEKPSGGILADDMGLGKTLTMISLILKSNEENDKNDDEKSEDSEEETENKDDSTWLSKSRPKLIQGKTLVVCPPTLLGQWEGEIKKRVKHGMLDVLVHHGANRENKGRRIARPDVVITTYNIICRDAAKPDQSPLFQIRWARVILDEAHQVRNYKTQTAQSVFQLKAKSRWALTGTPIHNKELDLFALLKFIRCRPFDDLAVWKKWVDNRDAAGIQRLNTITKSLMLRRTKQGLQEKGELSMTEKAFHNIFITLDAEEQEAYEKLLNFSKTLFSQFLHQKAEKENALTGLSVPSQPSHYLHNAENPFEKHPNLARLHKQMREMPNVKSHDILVLILRLRQFCCHPALIKVMLDKEDVADVGIEDNDGLDVDLLDNMTRLSLNMENKENSKPVETDVSALSSENALFAEDRLNSKMRKVLETLEEVLKSEDKVIVVSQWVSLLNLVECVLKARKLKCVKLTGSVQVSERAEIVRKFNRKGHDPRVMLLSLTAGGVGLNLVGGNHLLLLDLHWNPQLESQACDRIYRMGQEKNVHIYKFISSETIEERILKLQEKKLEVANNILTGAKHVSKLSLDDLKMLFQLTK